MKSETELWTDILRWCKMAGDDFYRDDYFDPFYLTKIWTLLDVAGVTSIYQDHVTAKQIKDTAFEIYSQAAIDSLIEEVNNDYFNNPSKPSL